MPPNQVSLEDLHFNTFHNKKFPHTEDWGDSDRISLMMSIHIISYRFSMTLKKNFQRKKILQLFIQTIKR